MREDLVMLSTKDLKYQMVERRTEKLTERFVGPYKIKGIASANAVELKLLFTVKIHPMVNMSRVYRYVEQAAGQRKEKPAPVIIEGEQEWEVEKVLNKQQIRGKDKYLVWWKGYMVELDIWEGMENLKNAKEAVEEFEKEYRWDIENIQRQERKENKGIFAQEELPGRFTARKLFGWPDKKYNEEYWARLERNWRCWKRGQARGQEIIETIKEEEEENEQEESRIREWTEEDNEMGNICDPYKELWRILEMRNLEREMVSWLGKMASQYLFFFSFSFLFFSKDQTCRRAGWIGACGTLQITVNINMCISSVQESNKDSNEFSLSTQIIVLG